MIAMGNLLAVRCCFALYTFAGPGVFGLAVRWQRISLGDGLAPRSAERTVTAAYPATTVRFGRTSHTTAIAAADVTV